MQDSHATKKEKKKMSLAAEDIKLNVAMQVDGLYFVLHTFLVVHIFPSLNIANYLLGTVRKADFLHV